MVQIIVYGDVELQNWCVVHVVKLSSLAVMLVGETFSQANLRTPLSLERATCLLVTPAGNELIGTSLFVTALKTEP